MFSKGLKETTWSTCFKVLIYCKSWLPHFVSCCRKQVTFIVLMCPWPHRYDRMESVKRTSACQSCLVFRSFLIYLLARFLPLQLLFLNLTMYKWQFFAAICWILIMFHKKYVYSINSLRFGSIKQYNNYYGIKSYPQLNSWMRHPKRLCVIYLGAGLGFVRVGPYLLSLIKKLFPLPNLTYNAT